MIERRSAIAMTLCTALLVLSADVFAERVRGPVVEIITIDSADEYQAVVTLRDLVAFQLDSDERLLQGVEIDLSFSQPFYQYRDGMIFTLYKQVFPAPTRMNMNYSSVESTFVHVRASSDSRYFIKLSSDAAPGNEQVLLDSGSYSSDPFLISIEPISKALPDTLAAATIDVKIRGVFTDFGILDLQVSSVDDSTPPFSVELDGVEKLYSASGYVLQPGTYELKVTVKDFAEVINCEVKKGEKNRVEVLIGASLPTVLIDAPDTAMVFLDGQRYRPDVHDAVEVVAGEHIVLIQLGDYAISKRFMVEQGQDYTISLFLDIIVEEKR